jgi:hypothetical protein
MGIPQQALQPIVETKPNDGPPGAILLRVVRSGRTPAEQVGLPDAWRYWLDPKRDYAALRWEAIDGNGKPSLSTVIEELEKSPSGIWHATRFRIKAVSPVEHDQVVDIFIDFDAKLPDSLFEPPAVGDELR